MKLLKEKELHLVDFNKFSEKHLKPDLPCDPLVPHYVNLYRFERAAEYVACKSMYHSSLFFL